MRIERLHIEGFGHYHDREISPFDSGLTVVQGHNEAGKTTLLAFIRAVLFGFPSRLGAQHYPPLRGGRHGGRVALRFDDGRAYTAERVQGRGRGPFQARGEDGEVLDEATFAPLIGHASETLFRSAFTFDLDGLPRFDAADGDLGGLLYGASMGAEQLPQTMRRLDGRIDDLFRPGGSNQKIARLLRERDEIEDHLREVASQADDYRQRNERHEQIAAELEAAQHRLTEHDRRRQEGEQQRRAWEDWTRLRLLDEQLANIEDTVAFPPDGAKRLDQAEKDIREAREALDEADRDLVDARREAERPVPDATLLESAEAIESLRRGRDAVDGSLRDLPERQAELRAREEELQRLLAALGPGWDEERLFAFDLSIPRRGEIERWQRRFEELRADQRDRDRDVEDARRQREDAAEAQRQAEERLDQFAGVPDDEAVRQRAAALRRLRDGHDHYERARQRFADLAAQSGTTSGTVLPQRASTSVRLVVTLAVGGAILAIGAFASLIAGQAVVAAVLGIGGAGALAAAGALALGSQRGTGPAPPVSPQLLDGARSEFASAEADLRRAAIGVIEGVDESAGTLPNAAVLGAAEEALDQARRRTTERSQAEERATETARSAERAQRRLNEVEGAREAAREARDQAHGEWDRWLAAGDLPADLAPQTAGGLLTSVEVARTKAEELRQWRDRVDAIRGDIQQYRRRAEPVARSLGINTAFADDRAAADAANTIIARFEAARAEQATRDQARVTVQERERAHERAVRRMTEAQQGFSALLEAGKVATAEAFRRRAAVHEERRALDRDHDDCEMRLRQVIGPEPDALKALNRALRETTLEEIESDVNASKAALAEAQRQRDALLDERGRVTTEIDQLHDDVSASEARTRAASLEAELQTAAREWSSLVVARALLRRTREMYERDRQPAVIQRASEFFATLTDGRYPRLYRPFGESTVTVEDRDGSQKTPEQLSRGTKEQLYLALRLGAIEEAARNHEGLPVIVDEVLVNFDPDRAQRAAAAFAQLAEHMQVIVFTCHPWIADLFEHVAVKPRVIDLD